MSSYAQMVKKVNVPKVNIPKVNISNIVTQEVSTSIPRVFEEEFPSLIISKPHKVTTQKVEPNKIEEQKVEPNKIEESIEAQQMQTVTDSVHKKSFRISEGKYLKKLEKKASKKNQKEVAEHIILQKQKELEQKATVYAQKAYDDEYTIAFIEEEHKKDAIKRAMSAYDKAYSIEMEALIAAQKAYDDASIVSSSAAQKAYDTMYKKTHNLVKKVKILKQESSNNQLIHTPSKDVTDQVLDETDQLLDETDQLLDDTDSEDEVAKVPAPKQILKLDQMNDDGFQVVKKTRVPKHNLFATKLEAAKERYVNDILTKEMLEYIQDSIKKTKTITIKLNITNDMLESGNNYTITKSGFLRNKLFSKYLSSVIFKKLNKLSLFVDITPNNRDTYNITLTNKAIMKA